MKTLLISLVLGCASYNALAETAPPELHVKPNSQSPAYQPAPLITAPPFRHIEEQAYPVLLRLIKSRDDDEPVVTYKT
jgi:hypothetical protein